MNRRSTWLMITGALLLSCVLVQATLALHRQTPSLVQITTAPSQDVGGASFIGNSNLVVFHSDGDLIGNGNTSSNIFLFDLKLRSKNHLPGLFQLTFGNQPSHHPTAARRGRSLAFESTADLMNNGSTGLQLFGAAPVKVRQGVVPLFQITKAAGSSFDAHLSENGRYLAFASTADIRNENLAPGVHVYRADLKKARLGQPSCPSYPCGFNPGLELLTRAVAGHPAIDKLGEFVVFDSAEDVLGPGTSNGFSQIYIRDFHLNATRRVTSGVGDSRQSVIARNGWQIVFSSAADLVGNGNNRFNIFQADISVDPAEITQLTFGTDGDSTAPAVTGRGDKIVFSSTADLTSTGLTGTNQLHYLEIKGNRITKMTNGADDINESSAEFTFFVFASNSDLAGTGNTHPQLFLGNAFKILNPLFPTPTVTATPTETVTPTPTLTATPTATTTPTPTPVPGEPANVGLALLVNLAADNGNDTLTTVIAGTVGDFYGNPVPDGTFVNFQVLAPTNGAVVTNGFTNMDPDPSCDIAEFTAATGQQITNQPGVANACVTYPRAQAGTQRTIRGVSGQAFGDGIFTLPQPAPTPTATPIPTQTATPTVTPTP
jgi:Tol biopolymer transport system component